MLGEGLNRLRARLDALRVGEALSPGVLDRARAIFERGAAAHPEALRALDRDLDKVGVHTAEDARLLFELGATRGRSGALSVGLTVRAQDALKELKAQIRQAERKLSSGKLPPGALTTLEQDYVRLARAVKVADLFASGGAGPSPARAKLEIYDRVREPREGAPPCARLAIAEFWAERARTAVSDLVQKRRDLDAAHELLLRLGTEADRARTRRLRLAVAQARERVRAAPATRTLQELVSHVRSVSRTDGPGAYRSLRALYERAVDAVDPELARAARDAAGALLPEGPVLKGLVERSELDELAAYVGPADSTRSDQPKGDLLASVAFDLDERRLSAFELAAACARYFDVEDALAEEIVEAETAVARPRLSRVSYPTQQMSLDFTNRLDELDNFLISHPRTLLYDLASNRQPLRAYLEVEAPPRKKRVRRTAVRVYVCDASGSMHGQRARFRDAIVIAELNDLRLKASTGQPFDPLYFSFFNDRPTELIRVDSAAEAARQIERLFGHSPAEGKTDISLALISAFDSIRAAQGTDPYLARATVVLVTDGENRVDLELIRRTRAPVGSLDIAFSFISLGEENQDLRALVLEQRSGGARAFYHHLSDPELSAARTEFDAPWRTLLPREVPATASALEALLPHLEALTAVAEGRPPVAPERPTGAFDALFPAEPAAKPPPPRPKSQSELTLLGELLEAISEAAPLAPSDRRAAEAVTLLHHLLSLHGWSAPRYLEALSAGTQAIHAAIARVRLLCRPFG